MLTTSNSAFTEPLHLPSHIEALLRQNSTERFYPAKKVFLEAGELMDAVYYIRHGRTKHYILTAEGAEKIIYTLGDGWFFGETPVIIGAPTGLISMTMEPTVLWVISRTSYQTLFDQHKEFRNLIMDNMARKMLILRHEIERISFEPVKQRILHLLCATADTTELVDGAWYPLQTKYTQYDIANIVGSARVTTSKLVGELCDEGKLRMLNHTTQVSKACVDAIANDTQ
ncbi:MAG: Crp/Fnr family transcriptional regulator [Sphaerochaetaceae bacterium]|nr:Crp/Fnr family transcriptional regulator [Spirochaetales bacterium]MDY5499836.1 Crp/Fnr family transcriptional regulator [Sphaerochaetaceae bacterium]